MATSGAVFLRSSIPHSRHYRNGPRPRGNRAWIRRPHGRGDGQNARRDGASKVAAHRVRRGDRFGYLTVTANSGRQTDYGNHHFSQGIWYCNCPPECRSCWGHIPCDHCSCDGASNYYRLSLVCDCGNTLEWVTGEYVSPYALSCGNSCPCWSNRMAS
jgi:hypothetical protein